MVVNHQISMNAPVIHVEMGERVRMGSTSFPAGACVDGQALRVKPTSMNALVPLVWMASARTALDSISARVIPVGRVSIAILVC